MLVFGYTKGGQLVDKSCLFIELIKDNSNQALPFSFYHAKCNITIASVKSGSKLNSKNMVQFSLLLMERHLSMPPDQLEADLKCYSHGEL